MCDLTHQIINEWGIPLSKVQFVITDNGSNIVKALKSDQDVAVRERDVEDDESDDESDDNLVRKMMTSNSYMVNCWSLREMQ